MVEQQIGKTGRGDRTVGKGETRGRDQIRQNQVSMRTKEGQQTLPTQGQIISHVGHKASVVKKH